MTGFAHGKARLKSPSPRPKSPAPEDWSLSPELVREQLHKLVTSRTFKQSKKLVRFLNFIGERWLLGQGDQINEYLIGVEVYERPSSFDPQTDTIVRGEARRLRQKLQQYYDTEGSRDSILVEVPKGAYVPLFLQRTPGASERSPGQLVSRYRLLEKLGEGGMGAVYRAEDTVLGRPVALKFLSGSLLKDNERRSRLFREARAAALIDHPNICTVHEIDEIDGHPFLVMAYIEGWSLEDRIAEGALGLGDALDIACQIADGLQAAHQRGVVHRDLKPANILVGSAETSDPRVRIIDFGLALLSADSRLTEPGTPIGTASYVSPEQMNGQAADQRSDIWSLGVILYEMLTGQRPFRGEHREAVFYAIAHLAPQPMNRWREGIPAELERLVSTCLEKDPSLRYPDVASLRADLARLRERMANPASLSTTLSKASAAEISHQPVAQPAGLFRRNRRWLLGGAVASLLVVVLSLFWAYSRQSRRNQSVSVAPHLPRVAVLPFESRMPGEENLALSYAISDSLITRLAKLSRLQVTSWTSVRRLAERKATVPEIARLLNVDYVLEGSFLKEGQGFRVTVQCIRTADETQVWSQEFADSWKNIFAVQKQVSEGVAGLVNAQLNGREKRALASILPRDSRAYQAYAQGHYYLVKYNADFQQKSLQDAEHYLKEAIEIAPDYSEALADLGWICLLQLYPQRDNQMQMVAEGTTYLERALALDPENVEAHCWLAGIYGFVGLTDKALELSRRAIELGPNNPEAHISLANRYREKGFFEAALAEANQAISNDHLYFLALQSSALYSLELGDFDSVLERVKQMETIDPTSPFVGWMLGNIAFCRGDLSQAEAHWARVLPMARRRSGIAEVALGLVATRKGQLEEGRRVLDTFRDRPGFGSNHLIRLAAAVGDKDLAIRLVRSNQYYNHYRWLITDPDMATLRNDPAFRELLNELYAKWQRDLTALAPSLPAPPPKLPTPQAYLSQRFK